MRSFSVLALGASAVAALQFQGPTANSTVIKGSTVDIPWSTIDTDPTSFSIYLVNFVNWPPFYTPLEFNVETSATEAAVRIPCDVVSSFGYQINAINGTNVYIIYAQSDKFSVGGASCVDPAPAPTCPPAATVTVTVSGNSTLTSAAPTVTSTYAGECPETIGWNGNYGRPVALTKAPAADLPVITSPPGSPVPKHCRRRRAYGHGHKQH